MKEVYDELDRHLAEDADIARASVPMGMLLAWCARHHLVSDAVSHEHEGLLLRLRVEEARGSELLAACGGNLRKDMFNAAGQAFLDRYYPRYMEDFTACFGGAPYRVEDNWRNYGEIARVISRAYHNRPGKAPLVERLKRGWRRAFEARGKDT